MPTDFPTPAQLHAAEQFVQSAFVVLPRVGPAAGFLAGGVTGAIAVCFFAVRLFDLIRLLRRPAVLLELTPPAAGDRTLSATQQLFSVLHGFGAGHSFVRRLLGQRIVFSFEVVSTRKDGIRFLVRVPAEHSDSLSRMLAAYVPDLRLQRVADYLPDGRRLAAARVLEFRQTGHFAYPLRVSDSLEAYDPVAYLAGTMTSLGSADVMALQVVLTPVITPVAGRMVKRLLHNEERLRDLDTGRGLADMDMRGMNDVLSAITDGVADVLSGLSGWSQKAGGAFPGLAAADARPVRSLSTLEQELVGAVNDKLSQPLYQVSIRALVCADKRSQQERLNGIRQALTVFSTPYQALMSRRGLWAMAPRASLRAMFRHRLPALSSRYTLLSAAEVANLYHFPHTRTANVENVVRSLSRTLPASVTLKQHTDNGEFDVVIGRNRHHGSVTDIGLTAAERERHMYVIGGTGNGKTTMLQHMILQDIRSGKGVGVIDPHGDLAETLLRYIPEARINDVIYFKPSDISYPIGLNLLELPDGLSGDERLIAEDFITEAVISAMRKTFSEDDAGGHRIEYVMRNAVHTALTVKGATIFTVFDLLTDPKYLKGVIANLDDVRLRNFWINEYGRAGDFQRVKMAAGITSKIGRFLFSASTERVMSQPRSTIDFDDILNGKILICNFAKGLIGEDTSALFGVSVLTKLQLAAYRRVKKPAGERRPFFLFVDEFQNFATRSFEQILSEARKYRMFLTIAEQSTSQQDRQVVDNILSNVGTIVCFRTGSPLDEEILLPRFRPYITEGEIMHLPSYNFYAKLSAVTPQEPVSGEIILLSTHGSEETAERVIDMSRKNYAHNKASYHSPGHS